jgi:NAD(P)H-dependent FMN reductase
MENPMSLTFAVVYGSARQNRQGIKAARFVVQQLKERGHTANLVDSSDYELPFLDKMFKEFEAGEAPTAMSEIGEIFASADGFVIVSAEYNHSIPAALKNLLDHYQSEYLFKPSAIITYSAGPFGGVRALVNLRAILAELGTPSIPSAMPISKIQSAFDDDGKSADGSYERRAVKFLDEFEWYAKAMKHARDRQACEIDAPLQQEMCRDGGAK